MSSSRRSNSRPRRRRRDEFRRWSRLTDEELLQVRLCDLGVRIEGSVLEGRIERLYEELEARGLRFRPHCWLSDEWFSPDGVPGVAIPFYLSHPRLARLEGRQMLEIEGGNEEWCLRILRHETGHAIDTAYRLHRRRQWQQVFGKASQPYPDHYQPRPYSRRFVQHLDMWYAQSHPSEDFAETFAVWLRPRSRWRSQYAGWPALKKLEYVDRLMEEVGDQPAVVTSRQHVEPLRSIRKTLGEHYKTKRRYYGMDAPHFYDSELRRLFSDAPEHAHRPSAAAFLRKHRREMRRTLSQWTGQFQYTINEVLDDVIARCRELNLRLDGPPSRAKRDALVMLTVQIMNYLHDGHHRVAL